MNPIDSLWVIISGGLVFIMQGGFALLESGLTRNKNSINVAIKNLTDLGVSLIMFWIVGFGLMFGRGIKGLLGLDHYAFNWGGEYGTSESVFFFFQAMFCSTAATIVSGAVAERMRFSAYILSTIMISTIIYPVVGHWVWAGGFLSDNNGWLGFLGFIDFAGSTVVHSVGGWVALAALLNLGPRIGRYNPDGSVNPISGSNIPNAVTGTILLWFGWFGFNGGSTLAFNDDVPGIILRTTLAAAAGMVGALAIGWKFLKVPDVALVINGSIGGLVAITANCHVVNDPQSLAIGAVGGIIAALGFKFLDWLRIDDAVSAIPAHLFAGVWGTLSVGIFGDLEKLGTGLDRLQQIGVQLLGIGVVGLWAFGLSYLLLRVINQALPLRVSEEDEIKGLNTAEHGATTEIYDLYKVLDEQSRTGDLSLRAPFEPFTEVGQIAKMYNNVMDNLQQNVVAKSEYLHILDNMSEGLFLIDKHGFIGSYFSSSLQKILHEENLAGKNIREILKPIISTQKLQDFDDYFSLLFNPDIDAKSIARLNPLERLEVSFGHNDQNEKAIISFTFKRISNENKVERVMGIARDLTEQVKLEDDVEKIKQDKASEISLLYKVLHMDPELIGDFINHFDERIFQMNSTLEKGQGSPRDVLTNLAKIAHGLKGDAALLNLDFIADSAHKLEDLITSLKRKTHLEPTDFLGLTVKISEIQNTGTSIRNLIQKLNQYQTNFLNENSSNELSKSNSLNFTTQLEDYVTKISKEKGKQITLDLSKLHLELLSTNQRPLVKDILVQLVRNAVVHGIETPDVRHHRSKPSMGKIEISLTDMNDHILIRSFDDGEGLNIERLKKKALEKNVPDSVMISWGDADWLRFAFSGQVSTAERLDQSAGRGVGWGLIRDNIGKLKGKLLVRFRSGGFMDIRIRIPKEV
jgi:Amt family ammonium transporter